MTDKDYAVGPKPEISTMPFIHLLGAACTGCGKPDPCGVHYEDCVLLEPGDWIVPCGQETAPPIEYVAPHEDAMNHL
jgi:hypothetical protein